MFSPKTRSKNNLPHKLLTTVRRKVMGTITRVSTTEAIAALTFDDGPHPEFTPRLLDILARHQARATFFMVGCLARRYPNLVRQVAEAGHAIGNHSWDHPSFPLISSRERRAQIRACAQALAPYGQRLFRPPYGHQNQASQFDTWRLGYQVFTWNIAAEDWLDHSASWLVERLTSRIQPGSIVLLHDGLYDALEEHYANREPILEAVDTCLEQLQHRFEFVTIPQLVQRGSPQRKDWYRQPDPEWLKQLTATYV